MNIESGMKIILTRPKMQDKILHFGSYKDHQEDGGSYEPAPAREVYKSQGLIAARTTDGELFMIHHPEHFGGTQGLWKSILIQAGEMSVDEFQISTIKIEEIHHDKSF